MFILACLSAGCASQTSNPPTDAPIQTANQIDSEQPADTQQVRASHQLCQARIDRAGELQTDELLEVSGAAASQTQPNVLWAHNDSDQEDALFAINKTGETLGRYPLTAELGDPEDIAIDGSTIYLADIGDNLRQRSEIAIVRVPEPRLSQQGQLTERAERLRFVYPDGPHDAEAFIIDPNSDDGFIITKEITFALDGNSPFQAGEARVYRVPLDKQNASEPTQAEFVASIDTAFLAEQSKATGNPSEEIVGLGMADTVTAADASRNNLTIVIRTYNTVWVFPIEEGQTFPEALKQLPCEGPASEEPQGEAIALTAESSRYFTLSESSRELNATIATTN